MPLISAISFAMFATQPPQVVLFDIVTAIAVVLFFLRSMRFRRFQPVIVFCSTVPCCKIFSTKILVTGGHPSVGGFLGSLEGVVKSSRSGLHFKGFEWEAVRIDRLDPNMQSENAGIGCAG